MKLTEKFHYPDDGVKSIMLLGVYAVMLLYPATMFIQKEIKTEYFAALVFMSFYGFLSGRIRPSQYHLERKDYLVLFSFALITIIAWVSYAHFGFQEYAKQRVEKYTWFLLAIPVYYLFLYTKPRMEIVWAGVVVGCFVAFGRAVLEELSLVDEIAWANMQGRANGSMHPIRFGDLSLLMGCIALSGAVNLTKLKPYARIIGMTAFIVAIGASVMSESRGGWIALPLLLLFVIISRIRSSASKWKAVIVTGVVILVVGFALFSFSATIQKRINMAVSDIELYLAGSSKSPIGARFDMFETALSIFNESPLFGVGVGAYHDYAKKYFKSSDREMSAEVVIWKNPHNEFFLQAATRGVIGVLSILILMMSILIRGLDNSAISAQFASTNLVLIALGYSIFGLTIALFEHKDFLLYFVIYVPVFLFGSRVYASKAIE